MKVATIVGARPQFVKTAMVSLAYRTHCPEVSESIIHTGQHYDKNMSEVFFEELGISPPALNLGIGGGAHGFNTGRMLEEIEKVLVQDRPDWVVVFGDTDSTLAGALAATKLHIPVAHVESGLRSFNRQMPEEINRVLADHASDRLFTPTDTATSNLAKEGFLGHRVRQVGDVMYDAVLCYGEIAERRSRILDSLGLTPREYILVTIHRAENTDDECRMNNILSALKDSDEFIVWPMHPRTRQRLKSFGMRPPDNVKVIPPTGYLDMIALEKNAAVIATDSGGIQKEAYFHGVPCVTLREETEWVELIDAGCNSVVGTDPMSIVRAIDEIRNNPMTSWQKGFYGHGNASELIAKDLSGQ